MKSFLLLLLSSISCFAQGYDYTIENGKDPYMYYFRTYAEHTLTAPVDNALSKWQTLPFPWKFFGESVSGYYISDNGYITFDRNAKESIPLNIKIPDSKAPLKSIFAFWTDLILNEGGAAWSNEVATSTVGIIPYRTHIIYWMRDSPVWIINPTDNISFFIAIQENGGFDIGLTVKSGENSISGTIGAINKDGSQYINIDPSPNYIFPDCGFGDQDDVCILFTDKTSRINVNSSKTSQLKCYPNPASDYIEIKTGVDINPSLPVNYYITNSLGKCVMSVEQTSPSVQKINISNLPPGVYFLNFTVSGRTYFTNFIKN